MRNRKMQKQLHLHGLYRESRLERKNEYGNDDLTPQEAVDRMIAQEKARRQVSITALRATMQGGG